MDWCTVHMYRHKTEPSIVWVPRASRKTLSFLQFWSDQKNEGDLYKHWCLPVCLFYVCPQFCESVHKIFTDEVGCMLCCSLVRRTNRKRPLTVVVKHPVSLGELCLALVLQILFYRKSASCETFLVLFWINCMLSRPSYRLLPQPNQQPKTT